MPEALRHERLGKKLVCLAYLLENKPCSQFKSVYSVST
jgi:hypothetical protein